MVCYRCKFMAFTVNLEIFVQVYICIFHNIYYDLIPNLFSTQRKNTLLTFIYVNSIEIMKLTPHGQSDPRFFAKFSPRKNI